MPQLPQALLNSLQNIEGFDETAFRQIHESDKQVTSIRINPLKCTDEEIIHHSSFMINKKVPWSDNAFYLQQRPSFTFDPLFHAGCYYVQEASSMFLEQALKQTADLSQPIKVLDLCAAPGGKSTHIQSLISKDSLLVSNEVIRSRANILIQNIIKWGCNNVVVTNNDPQHFVRLEGYFDVMVVDAPCSGSGLFRRDEEAINEWSVDNVMLCCGRQKRILADALPALKEDGVLIYSTCSYSKEEDEDIATWLVQEMEMENVKLKLENDWNIVITKTANAEGYRFYPYKLKGEGFFISCFRKKASTGNVKFKTTKPTIITAKEKAIIQPWIEDVDLNLLYFRDGIIALPSNFLNDFSILQNALNVHYAGVSLGQIMKDKLVPHHALALSTILSEKIIATELSYEHAIKYLQRADLNIETESLGWQPVSFHKHNLGWINALKNRVNNYYPKEFRILKQSNDAASRN
jgi:NOL1/NOP2/sun family putative RNA methylase